MKNKEIKILMIGSDLSVKGGIVSVIRNYLEYEKWGNIKVSFIPSHKEGNKIFKIFYFVISLIKIVVALKKTNYDITHIHVSERGSIFRKNIIINAIKKFSANTKIVLHHHGAEFEDYYNSLTVKKQKKIKEMLKKVDVNIVLSNKLIDSIVSKESKATVKVLYNAVNTYEKNMYNNEAKDILFLGRLGERKGTYDLLEVLKELRKELEQNKIKVNLCGDGEIEKVKEIVKEYGLKKIIKHIGWIDSKEKKEIFSRTIMNILPSYNEGLPMTILETMSYGIPNISTNIASIPEVIINEENGYLIEPGDKEALKEKIMELINNSEKRQLISEKSFKTIKTNFSIEKHINKLVGIYKRLE